MGRGFESYRNHHLGVAQPGSASGLGPEGREFESLHRDHERVQMEHLTQKDLAVVTMIALVMSQSLLYGNIILLCLCFWVYNLYTRKRLND